MANKKKLIKFTVKPKLPFSCAECQGACCRVGAQVEASPGDLVRRDWLVPGTNILKQINGVCIGQCADYKCSDYEHRPTVCRQVQPGDRFCLFARWLKSLPYGVKDEELWESGIKSIISNE